MPTELSADLLADVLSRTLEEAAFVCVEPVATPPPVDAPVLEATVRYAGPAAGVLRLAGSERFASSLAASMLGEEEGGAAVTGDDADAVGELLNMVAGATMLEAFGRYAACSIGIPRVRRLAPAAHADALAAARTRVTLVDDQGRRVDLSSGRDEAAA